MTMMDWIRKLDDFLKVSDKKILTNKGKISHDQAIRKAKKEFKDYKSQEIKKYVSDFDREVKKYLKKK